MKKVITAALVGGAIVGSLLGAGTASATTSGTFLVPTEISPGSYRVVSSDGTGTGYWETCAPYACEGSGIIDNDFFNNSSSMVVSSDAVAVKLDGVTLTKIG